MPLLCHEIVSLCYGLSLIQSDQIWVKLEIDIQEES